VKLTLFEAADHGDTFLMDEVIQKTGADINKQDDEGRTPLLMGVRNGHIAVVSHLVEKRANMELQTKHMATPLGLASWRGFLPIMQILIDASADVSGASHDPAACRPAIYWAADAGKEEAVSLLLDSSADIYGCPSGLHATPLQSSAKHGHVAVIRLLLERGASVLGKFGGEPLQWSARNGFPNVCSVLLEHKTDPGYTDDDGVAALMWSCARGNCEVAQLLIKAKAVVDQTMEDGRTSLMLAARRGHRDVVKLLLDSGASLYLPLQQLEESGDVERIASTISLGVTLLRGIPLEAFARRLSPVTAAQIIKLGGHAAFQLVEGLFQEKEVILAGSHAVNNLTLAYMFTPINVAADPVTEGPDQCWVLKPEHFLFAPQAPLPWYDGAKKVDVQFMRCVLPNVWDTSMVHALSEASGVEVYQGPYAEAIVSYAWMEVWHAHAVILSLEAACVLLLGWIAMFISDANADMEMEESAAHVPQQSTFCLTLCFGMMLPYQGFAYFRGTSAGHVELPVVIRYVVRVGMVVMLLLCMWEITTPSPAVFRGVAAVVSTFEWVGFLDGLTAFSLVGPAIMPTLTAMRDIWVMAGVLVLVLLAAIHAHVLLTRTPFGQSYLVIWRLGLLGDFELGEFSGTSALQESFDGPIKTLLLMISFGVNLVLMNIFIGVVGNSYDDALHTAKANFLRKRAKICVMHKMGPLSWWLDQSRRDSRLWVCYHSPSLDPQ